MHKDWIAAKRFVDFAKMERNKMHDAKVVGLVGSGMTLAGSVGVLCKIVDMVLNEPHPNGVSFVGFTFMAILIFVGSIMSVYGHSSRAA